MKKKTTTKQKSETKPVVSSDNPAQPPSRSLDILADDAESKSAKKLNKVNKVAVKSDDEVSCRADVVVRNTSF